MIAFSLFLQRASYILNKLSFRRPFSLFAEKLSSLPSLQICPQQTNLCGRQAYVDAAPIVALVASRYGVHVSLSEGLQRSLIGEQPGTVFYILGGFTHFLSCYACIYRTKLRNLYNIRGSDAGDCLASCFCPHMALCQEYRELKARGFDMSAGWQGNVEKQAAGVKTVAPAIEGGMSR